MRSADLTRLFFLSAVWGDVALAMWLVLSQGKKAEPSPQPDRIQ
jgi:hypothetical protein